MNWKVKFKWKDIQNQMQYEEKEFEDYDKAKEFYMHIRKTTEELILQYGRLSIRYNPYLNIELSKGE